MPHVILVARVYVLPADDAPAREGCRRRRDRSREKSPPTVGGAPRKRASTAEWKTQPAAIPTADARGTITSTRDQAIRKDIGLVC